MDEEFEFHFNIYDESNVNRPRAERPLLMGFTQWEIRSPLWPGFAFCQPLSLNLRPRFELTAVMTAQ
jgi:hypothetical protein